MLVNPAASMLLLSWCVTCAHPQVFVFQVRRVQPSVPELSLLIDSSFMSNHSGPTHRAPPSPVADRKPALLNSSSASKSSPPAPPHHSTPNPNLQQPCSCCPSRADNCTSIFSSSGLPPAQLPAAACPSLQAAPPPHSHNHTPPAHHQTPTLSLLTAPAPPSHSHHTPAPPPSTHPHYRTLPPSGNPHSPPASILTVPLSSQPHTPPRSSNQTAPLPSAPPVSCSPSPLPSSHHHTPPCISLPSSFVPWCVESCSSLPSLCAAPPPCVNPCCGQVGGVVPADTYHLLLQQDRQLRLLQAQVW